MSSVRITSLFGNYSVVTERDWSEIVEVARTLLDAGKDAEIDLVEAGEDDLCDVLTADGKPIATIANVRGFGSGCGHDQPVFASAEALRRTGARR